jgi:two-component system, response regulator PdtaR
MCLQVPRAALKRRLRRVTAEQGADMSRYFFDFDDGKDDYVDAIGTELTDPESVPGEATAFLASVFRDAAHDARDRILQVSVRNDSGSIVLTTTLSLQSQWGEASQPARAAGNRPVVLIVDNEFLSRMTAAEMISDRGFEIVEAENAELAIAVLEARRDVKVVFTDIRLSGSMDGLKLANHVNRRWPSIKIIATSGHPKVSDDLPDGGVFLPKPYTADRVAAVIRECIGAA